MTIRNYIRDKTGACLALILLIITVTMMGYAFKALPPYIAAVDFLIFLTAVCLMSREFYKKKHFYQEFLKQLEQLDQKYFITEIIRTPNFYEGQILYESLREINKSMIEKLNETELNVVDFKEYLEMWIHQMKIPMQELMLMNFNGETDISRQKKQIQRMNHYIEQILFYAKADAPEKDYLLTKCNLEATVNKVILENKELLIGNKITISKEKLDYLVITDSKWLEFILGQIVNNSIKYIGQNPGYLKFSAHRNSGEREEKTVLVIEDHGIGIRPNDIQRVFEKSFTGANGRKRDASTGMGLYLCKKLCDKLGHKIWIESKEGAYTKVYIEFGAEDYYLGM